MSIDPATAHETSVRLAAFEFLRLLEVAHPNGLRYADLTRGFEHEGQRVPLMGPQGIFKPRVLRQMPLSVTTVAHVPGQPRPYEDGDISDGVFRYCYRGQDPQHHENVGLREAMRRAVPLVYFKGLVPGLYDAVYPVYVVGDDPARLLFSLQCAADASGLTPLASVAMDGTGELLRRYVTRQQQVRLHQREFSQRVLVAYRKQCCMCRLRHTNLLDAAHILPDKHPHGVPHVSNGLALCKIHHAAFDANLIGVTPDLNVAVQPTVLEEEDGPMLQHGLKGMHGVKLQVPRQASDRPAMKSIAERYEGFLRAC